MSEVKDAVRTSCQKFPWSWKKNVRILIDMNGMDDHSVVVRYELYISIYLPTTHTHTSHQALELEDDKNQKIGYGMVLLSDLADQKEHDDWFPVFQKKDHQIGWLHLHLCLEKPKHKALDMATTQNASVKGDVAVKPVVPSKKVDDLSILDGKYVVTFFYHKELSLHSHQQ